MAEKSNKINNGHEGEEKREIFFEIVEEIGILSVTPRGWQKELNLVKWNNGKARYDIRDWKSDRSRMSKGITLSEEEFDALKSVISSSLN